MTKKVFLILTAFLLVSTTIQAQEVVEGDSLYAGTKYGELLLNRGCFIKRVDSNTTSYDVNNETTFIDAQIQSFYINEQTSCYFYKLSRKISFVGEFSTYIWYKDVDEIIKAIHKLQESIDKDCEKSPEYLTNSYITRDGFEIGYSVKKKGKKVKAKWYMKWREIRPVLEIQIDKILAAFKTAQVQIGEIIQNDRDFYKIAED